MVILLTGASHTGKTALAQKLLERYKMPCLSLDHLKMGLIRSGYTQLTPEDDAKLIHVLWPIVREMVKTVVENGQNLIVEGCCIPFDWAEDFAADYREQIRFYCLVMGEGCIRTHFSRIMEYANVIESRLADGWCTMERLLEENARFSALAQAHGANCIRIDDRYEAEIASRR